MPPPSRHHIIAVPRPEKGQSAFGVSSPRNKERAHEHKTDEEGVMGVGYKQERLGRSFSRKGC